MNKTSRKYFSLSKGAVKYYHIKAVSPHVVVRIAAAIAQ
jgi:hypothetical protein